MPLLIPLDKAKGGLLNQAGDLLAGGDHHIGVLIGSEHVGSGPVKCPSLADLGAIENKIAECHQNQKTSADLWLIAEQAKEQWHQYQAEEEMAKAASECMAQWPGVGQ